MADNKKDDKKADTAAPKKKKSGKGGFLVIVLVFGLCAPFFMPTLTLFLVGMLPTFIALLADTDPHKSSTTSVASMNCAGLTPFLIDLWIKGQTMENAFAILRDPQNWMIILGAAGIGQLIVFAVPQAMASLTLARAESRLKIMKNNLEQLKTSWGPEVATTKPLDKISR